MSLLGYERKRSSAPEAHFSHPSILEDYDFHMLLQTEWNSIRQNVNHPGPFLKNLYQQLGGSFDNGKAIIVELISNRVNYKLDNFDIPGIPDELVKPKIKEKLKELIGKDIDDFFAEKP